MRIRIGRLIAISFIHSSELEIPIGQGDLWTDSDQVELFRGGSLMDIKIVTNLIERKQENIIRLISYKI